jgi:hypothetical protein
MMSIFVKEPLRKEMAVKMAQFPWSKKEKTTAEGDLFSHRDW